MDNRLINIIAVGGGASNIGTLLATGSDQVINFVNTDQQALNRLKETFSMNFSGECTFNSIGFGGGLGAGGQAEEVYRYTLDNIEEVTGVLREDRRNLVIACLGGGTGTGVSRAISEFAAKNQVPVGFVVSLPFHFERSKKNELARRTYEEISSNHPTVFFENESILKFIDRRTSIRDAFLFSDEVAASIVKDVVSSDRSQSKESEKYVDEMAFRQLLDFCDENAKARVKELNESSIVVTSNMSLVHELIDNNEKVKALTPGEFEDVIGDIYSLLGYEVKTTKKTRDDGADLLVWSSAPISKNDFLTIVQAKRYQKYKVGASDIRDLYGAKFVYNADRAQCITTYGFSPTALDYGLRMNIDLFMFNELIAKLKQQIEKGN